MTGSATRNEMTGTQSWFAEAFLPTNMGVSSPPISFRYDGRDSASFIGSWHSHFTSDKPDAEKTRHTLTLTDPETGLECRCQVTTFTNFPAIEWVALFHNLGDKD